MSVIIPQNAEITGGGGSDDQIAVEVPYSNGISGLSGVNVQDALDEIASVSLIQDVSVLSNYTVLAANDLILVDSSGGVVTITLPAIPEEHKVYIVKDSGGAANVNNITISGNGNLIDGSATILMQTNYEALDFIFDGIKWNVL